MDHLWPGWVTPRSVTMKNVKPDRYDYTFGSLDEANLPAEPFGLLEEWLAFAAEQAVVEPMAMCVSTVFEQRPSSRMVLLRSLDSGLVFYTNYLSRKGKEIDETPWGCANFWWGALERQVRIEGSIEKTSRSESVAYFNSRPTESKIASAASPQSQVVSSRSELEALVAALDEVECPEHWGGYRLIPSRFEFWQGRPARLHDRIIFERHAEGWRTFRLAP